MQGNGWLALAVVGTMVLSCGEGGCCGCGGCDCGLGELWADWEDHQTDETQHELREVDPVAHAWLRAQPEIVAAVGGEVERIEYRLFLGSPLPLSGTVGQEVAKKVKYRVIGRGGQEVEVEVVVVRRDERWVVSSASYLAGGTRTRLGETIDFVQSSGSGGGGWD